MHQAIKLAIWAALLAGTSCLAPIPSCNGTACMTMQCIAQNVELAAGGSFNCSSAVPCHSLLCSVSDGEELSLTVLECNQPTAVRLVNRYSGEIQFNHTFTTDSEIVNLAVNGTNVILNVTIQHLKRGTTLGLQIDAAIPGQGTVTFIPYSEIPIDKFSCSCSSGTPCVPFIPLGDDAITLPRVSDGASGPITLPFDFPFGEGDHSPGTVYVTTDGYFSVGNLTINSDPHLFSNDSSFDGIVAPFWANADPSKAGSVSYQIFTPENGSEFLEKTRILIESREGIPSLDGGWMLVAEWHQVPQFGATNMATNTFQGILFKLKNFNDAYAVFTYHCGDTSGMQWSGNATIGWKSGSSWRNHLLSGGPNASSIACDNYPSVGEWSNMVYSLVVVEPCPGQFGCANGACAPFSVVCDGQGNCYDGSDESGCSSTPTSIPPTETPSVCSGTACATMQCIIQYIESHFQSLFACSTAVPCVNVLCSAGDGSSFDLTILECKQPAAVRVVTRNTESVVLFNRTLSHSEIVTVPLGIDYILNATIQHLNDGTILGLQMNIIDSDPNPDPDVTLVPHSEFPLDTSSCFSDATCKAMESIARSAEAASDGLTCSTSPPCSEIDCAVDTGEELEFVVLKCNDPPAIQLLLRDENNVLVYDQTFTESGFAQFATGGSVKILNVTVTHGDNAIGVQIDVFIPDEQTGYQTFVPYTSIPIDTSSCSQDATCKAMESIARSADAASDGLTCFTSPSCSEVDCAIDTGEKLQFVVLKCSNPPALRLLLENQDNALVYNQTFTESGFATFATGGVQKILNITLTHGDKTMGVQIDVLDTGEQTGYQTFVPYTSIPIDTSSCSQSEGPNRLILAVALPLGVALVLVLVVLVVLISVLLYKRRKRGEFRFQPMSTFADTDE